MTGIKLFKNIKIIKYINWLL